MIKKLLFPLFCLMITGVFSQNLYDDANAASPANEADATTGWAGTTDTFSDNTDAQSGVFSLRAVSNGNNGTYVSYTFDAVIGQDYNITIWARRGAQFNNPAFANWQGMAGFSTTPISTGVWTQYNWTVTANSASPSIRVYCSPWSARLVAGNTVFLDNISIVADGADTEAPTAVTDLSSANTTFDSTDLSWSASTDNVGVTNYEIFQDGVSIGNTGTTTFNVTGLAELTSYDFTVFAQDAAGNTSPVSNTETVVTLQAPDTEAPTAVTDLASANTTTTTTDLTWSASTDNVGVTNYEVFQDGVSIANTGTTTAFNVTGLAPSTSYDFTVFAEDAAGNVSLVSNTETVVTAGVPDAEAPTAVTDLSSANTTFNSTDLSWSASTDNIGVTNYEVFQDGVSIANTGTTTAFNVTGLAELTSYDFTVFAQDAAGNTSPVSNTETVVTLQAPDTEAPSAITDLASANTTTTTTDLSWSASTDNVGVTNYEVFQDGVSIANTGITTAFNVTGLTPSTSYDFTVFAEDAAGNVSAVSNTETVNTDAVPDTEAPTAVLDLSSSGTTSNSTSLSWSASTDNVGVTNYEVFQDGVSIANTGTTASFNVGGLTPSTSYDFTVFAEDAAGNVSAAGNTETVLTFDGGGIIDYTSENANLNTVDWTARDLFADRNLGIGTTDTQGYRLAIAGNMIAEGVRVELQTNWPDYVFESDFDLKTLEEVKKFIAANGHLPNIPSAKQIEKEGIDLGTMNVKLLEKIEELTLYLLAQDAKIKELELKNTKIEGLLERIEKLENEKK